MSTVSLQELQQSRPAVELKLVTASSPNSRPFGLCAGAFTVPADFDASLQGEILRDFEGLSVEE